MSHYDRVLYGLRSIDASFQAYAAKCIQQLGYQSCKVDPDLWWKPETRPQNKFKYFLYILCYVNDILCVHHDPENVVM